MGETRHPRLAGALAVILALAPPAARAAAMSAEDWLDTIRVPLRDGEPGVACPGAGPKAGRLHCGPIEFEPGTDRLSADGRRSLDSFGEALASPCLQDSKFSVLWLADSDDAGGLAERRAETISGDLRARPALPPERVSIQQASAADDCPQPPLPNALLLQARIAGRWWGGQ